jgi:hypothetical protein
MTAVELIQRRLWNQRLTQPDSRAPGEVVAWLGAVQSQDYPAATWGIGQRAKGVTNADVDEAFDRGALLRTHMLRPTWHFVAPADIRWMLGLSAPRVHAMNRYYYRKFELDPDLLARSRRLVVRVLRDGHQLTRTELASMLGRAGIAAAGSRLAYLLMHAELDGVICSGARRGNQFTYALLDERVPATAALARDEALAELTRRYFSSRGPATTADFAWWSGLTVSDAKRGLEATESAVEDRIEGRTCWLVEGRDAFRRPRSPSVHLLPNYDEFGIAYKHRDVVPSIPRPARLPGADEFAHLLVLDGQLVGRWKRTRKPAVIRIEVQLFRPLQRHEQRALAAEADRHGRFMNLPVELSRV